MKVAILAAGVGTRLDRDGQAPPKALLRFAGETLLKRHLDILVSFGLGDITLVVGHRADEIERELAALGAADLVRTRLNPEYRTSSLLSLWTLREVLRAGEPVLYMDADVLDDRRLLERLLGSPHDDCILIDRDIDPDDEWLDVRVRAGRIVAFDKGVTLEDYDLRAEWVGFARFSARTAARLAGATEGYVERGRVDVSYEAPMRDVILETPAFGLADATGLPWIEIDFPADLRRAHREILPRLVRRPAATASSRDSWLGKLGTVTILQRQGAGLEARLARRSKAWRGDELTRGDVMHRFSPAAQTAIAGLLSRGESELPGRREVDLTPLAAIGPEIEVLRRRVEELHGFAIVEAPAVLREPPQRRALTCLIGRLLGEPVEQSGDGAMVIEVYDRDRRRRMEDGARFHQTRQGGSLHTDNVNRPQTSDYLMMACVVPAMLGGESIVVSGLTVHDLLRQHAPRALEVLAEDFWWECRGFSDDFFRAPVLFFDQRGEPQFRYLREYLESAHRRRGEPLRDEQLWALDALDAALELSEVQFRCRLTPGEILVIDDLQMFHGRTSFSDFFAALPYEAAAAASGHPPRRCFDRLWISRRAS